MSETRATVGDVPRGLLRSVHNVRDVAGPGYRCTGGVMARGVVYRAPALAVADDEVEALGGLGVTCVVDLRTDAEVATTPDVVPEGARYLQVDVLEGHRGAVTLDDAAAVTPEVAAEEMVRTYESFVRREGARKAFGQAVLAVAQSPGASIVHCTAGKDRTGWTAAVLQLLAGVGDDDVVADYLLTDEYSTEFVAGIREFVEAEMPDQLDVVLVLVHVEERYLRTSLDALRADYGDVRGYLVEGAGLDPATVDGLAERLRATAP